MKRLAGFISAAGMVFAIGCGQTDAGITTAVKSKMAADDTVKAYQVDVDTNNHVVTLKGDVNSSLAKERAVTIARTTDGVTDVIDQIRVTGAAATSGRLDTDDDVNIRVHDDVKSDDVTIKVDDGVKADADRAATKTKNAAERGAQATKNGAEKVADKTVDTTKKVGEKTAQGAKKVGSKVKDVFTDDNKDSDHDGH